MAGRRVFFSFHYERDIWRASNVRQSGAIDAKARAGFSDASLWEKAKKQGDQEIRHLINVGLEGTSVTAVLIGTETANRPWINYEIRESIKRGNGLLGIRIHGIKDQDGRTSARGSAPDALLEGNYSVHDWDRAQVGKWIERAAIDIGKPCLSHQKFKCWQCKWWW
jgi:hypothetical protein